VHEGTLDEREIAGSSDAGQPQQTAQSPAMRLASYLTLPKTITLL
jgi:hypothetical protein